jgi:hypothetical protein
MFFKLALRLDRFGQACSVALCRRKRVTRTPALRRGSYSNRRPGEIPFCSYSDPLLGLQFITPDNCP